MKKPYASSVILGALALLFASLFITNVAKAQDHLTYAQVENALDMYASYNRAFPDALYWASFHATGVTLYQNGTFKLDTDTTASGTQWTQAQEDIYYAIVHGGCGDPSIAIEAALGLLTWGEEQKARYPDRLPTFTALSWFTGSWYYDFQAEPPGGGGGDHDQG